MGPTMRRATSRALSRSSWLGYVWGLEETGALALIVFFTLHYRMYYKLSLVATDSPFLASGDLKTRLTFRARSINRLISRYYKIYIRARENGLNGRNGMKKITRLSIVKRNGNRFFDSYCIHVHVHCTCTCMYIIICNFKTTVVAPRIIALRVSKRS